MHESTIHQATLHDMQFLLTAAKTEGWNPGLCDTAAFYYTDPQGFFIEKLGNEPIGCISAVAYNDSYGFMGFYFVLPKYRHQGYGSKLGVHALKHMENRTIGLDGVVAMQENYKKSGFTFYYNNFRFGGSPKGKPSPNVCPIDMVPFQTLLEYDQAVCGVNRGTFLKQWIIMPNAYGMAKMDHGKLLGYGIIRKCDNGYRVGPLFADDHKIADEILLSLVSQCHEGDIFLDIPDANKEALDLAHRHGLRKVFETARMYNKTPPSQTLSKIFAVTSLELG